MFNLDAVKPWGRSFDEYARMFALSDADLQLRILGCADGPAGFNAEAAGRNSHFLFLYSRLLGADFHVAAARELMRVARARRRMSIS